MQEKCFSFAYLTLRTENELILFSSTERKITVLVHLQLKFTVDLQSRETTACFAFIQNGSDFPRFPLRRAAREAAFLLTTFTIITPSKDNLPLDFTTYTVNMQIDAEK